MSTTLASDDEYARIVNGLLNILKLDVSTTPPSENSKTTTLYGTGNPHSFGCVHAAGDWKLYKYNVPTRFTVEQRKNIISLIIALVNVRAQTQVREAGMRTLKIVQESTGTQQNYMNNMYADDLLCEIASMIAEERDQEVINTTINMLAEQMSDLENTKGYCPSGRQIRVFEVYMFLRDYTDKLHLPLEERGGKTLSYTTP